jgi:prepilin-type N-terminal cleavage/methylation domain-containing protein
MTLNNQKGFTLIELVIATAVIGILASVSIPAFKAYKIRAYDSTTQASLKSVFTACKDYWTVNSSNNPCLLTTLSNPEYGFTPSDDVEITIDSNANNTEYDFIATASHKLSSSGFKVDFTGVVSTFNIDDNGNGCSDKAQNDDPLDLGKNAKGGCGTAKGKK